MILISPAKKLNLKPIEVNLTFSEPVFIEKAKYLIKRLKNLNKVEVKNLLNVSDKLTLENFNRFQSFEIKKKLDNFKPAIYTFSGDTFVGLDIYNFSMSQILNAQRKIRILSGLYGILKPLDIIQPHRLEMGTKTNVIMKKSLYEFWGNLITEQINEEIKKNNFKFLLNLASDEYFKSINLNILKTEVYKIKFYFIDGKTSKNVGMYAKRLRGAMAGFFIKSKISDINGLKLFSYNGFNYDSEDEKNKTLFFTKRK